MAATSAVRRHGDRAKPRTRAAAASARASGNLSMRRTVRVELTSRVRSASTAPAMLRTTSGSPSSTTSPPTSSAMPRTTSGCARVITGWPSASRL